MITASLLANTPKKTHSSGWPIELTQMDVLQVPFQRIAKKSEIR